ncbi:FbpB family small basic protein [Niallia oryzisoli]|uniref:FbpB family small basic protein n=1 Tax=Niallia oryzisoli TaxID=1737571 RepID=A0ABZ2CE77_9BACI
MNKRKKRSLEELFNENKLQLLQDQSAIEKIEAKLENKYICKAK